MTEADWLLSEDPAAMLAACMAHTTSGQVGFVVPEKQGCLAYRPSDRKLRLFACACLRIFGPATSRGHRLLPQVEALADQHAPESEYEKLDALLLGNGERWAEWWAAKPGIDKARQAAILREIAGNPFLKPSWHIHRCVECGQEGRWHCPANAPDQWPRCPDCGAPTKHRILLWRSPTVLAIAQRCYDERPGRKCERCNSRFIIKDPPPEFPLGYGQCPDCHGTGTIQDGTLDIEGLAVLADALEDAGCTDQDMLGHLRGQEVIVRRIEHAIHAFPCPHCGGKRKRQGDLAVCERCMSGAPMWTETRQIIPLRGPHVRGCWCVDLILGKE